jgi:hypothetical protein
MIVFGAHAARRHLIDLIPGHIGNCTAAPYERLKSLHFLKLDGGYEIPHGPAVAGHSHWLTLGDFPVLAEVPGKFGGWDFTHYASLSITKFTHFVYFVKGELDLALA